MQRLGMAARACRAHGTARQLHGEALGHLRARAVARAEKEHARERRARLLTGAAARSRCETRVQRNTGARQQLAAPGEIQDVVRVAAVRGAATHRNEATVAELAQVVGNQALLLADQLAELAYTAIAVGELAQ